MSFQTDFINKHKQAVVNSVSGTGIFPSVKMAQMILESGWGKDAPVILANNYFGIKAGSSWKGEKIALSTPKDGSKVNYFRKYASVSDSIKDHSNILVGKDRYIKSGVFSAKTPEEQAHALSKGGYAESKNYAGTLITLIDKYDLKNLDKMLLSKSSGKVIVNAIVVAVLVCFAYFVHKKYMKA